MTERVLAGLPASPGVAAGLAKVLDAPLHLNGGPLPESERPAEAERAVRALGVAAAEIEKLAAQLEEQGNTADAEIVATGALMAADPGLISAVRAAALNDGSSAAGAILRATDSYAQTLASLDDPTLALRADDVRSLGRRAARLATPASGPLDSTAGLEVILVASDLGPADVAELGPRVRAVALAAGGTTAHAAIVARSLGIPMVVAAGNGLLEIVEAGAPLVVDGDNGTVTVAPGREARRRAHLAAAARVKERELALAARTLPAETADGRRLRVLANVATATEVGVALAAGADGVGLLRTELGFLEARAWPTEQEHRRLLVTTLAPLTDMVATVRLLDFGGDKTPPFLAGTDKRGIALLLTDPAALHDQARAIASAGAHTVLRVLLPMVERAEEVEIVRAAFETVAGAPAPAIGAMIETTTAVESVDAIAAVSDFLSIGTNDLTHSVLATDRYAPGEVTGHHPRVLQAIAAVSDAAAAHALPLEVCGEAASNATVMPLLLGLGVNELSVGAARVGTVRRWVRSLQYARAREIGAGALELESAADVEQLVAPTAALLGELGDAAAERVERGVGVVAVGRQP